MSRKKLLQAVEDGTQTAVDHLSPYVEQALRDGGELADQTYSRLRPALKDAGIRGARFASDTFERVHPTLDDVLDRVSPTVDATLKAVQPAVEDVLGRIPPTVDYAREKVQAEYLPQLASALRDLAHQPLARELKVAAASAALAKELEKVSEPKRSKWKVFGLVVLAGAALGGVVIAVRKLLADPSTGWETHTPKTAYVADPVADVVDDVKKKAAAAKDKVGDIVDDVKGKAADLAKGAKDAAASAADQAADVAKDASGKLEDVTGDAKDAVSDLKDKAADVAKDVTDKAEDATKDLKDTAGDLKDKAADAADDAKDKAADAAADIETKLDALADEAEGGDASPLAGSPYGEGSFVGDEPPQGYDIKGNDRSMKYHVPGSVAYERTVAQVWFNSEEAAQAAGFVRTQR